MRMVKEETYLCCHLLIKSPINMRRLWPWILSATLLIGCKPDDQTEPASAGIVVKKWTDPVVTVENGLAADPSVIRVGDQLLMIYSEYSLATDAIAFHAVVSSDGINWQGLSQAPGSEIFSGSATNDWDRLIETPELIRIGEDYYLYYIGYPDAELNNGIYASQIGLAIGTEPESIARVGDVPLLARGGPVDVDALTSPSVVEHEGTYYMLYTGWSNILSGDGFLGQTAATSTDGISWNKLDEGIFTEVATSTFETATEADIVKGTDGLFYLFYSAEGGIALARSDHPLGPWELYPEMLISSELTWESGEVVAPTALIENGKAKIWYSGIVGNFGGGSIGYAEIDFPFEWD